MNKKILDEADYKSISKLRNDNFNYELKIDMANEIINDISDNVYIISNKLEAIQKIAKSIGLNIDFEVDEIIGNLNGLFEGVAWDNILSEFDFNSMLKDFGDAFGITDIFNEKKEEWEKKDKEREKINQARIKRKQEREKAKLNQNITNNNSSDIDNVKNKKINQCIKVQKI